MSSTAESTLSAVVLTLDEEEHLPACLQSIYWADEVLVLDSFSSDSTAHMAREAGVRVEQRVFVNYAAQRNAALALARGEWVLFVDADERVSDELRIEIQELIASHRPSSVVGFWIPRRNYIFGAWVQHSGWYPDRQLRLMQRARARYDATRPVHELVVLDGEAGVLQGHLVHLNYENVGEFVRKQRAYARYEAQQLFASGRRARARNFVLQPLREFNRRLIRYEGYRDGWRGWLLSALMAWHTLTV
ncbi:MAG: glycosyltransferase family 2 protein, partial [Chloroflexi bacterium]|nr:glycosyltransferase family 2 protein [Chloroflexota bacterium]